MQLSSVFPLALFNTEGTNHSQLDALLKNGIGHVSALGLIGHKTPETLAKSVNAIQRYLVTETRLKIPAIFHNEAMSGVVAPHFTAFPTSIGLAATWDPAAVEEMADIIRRQMRAVGLLQALAPVMDVARDARWGRVSETYGEDPYLVSAMSVAYTRGLQGKDLSKGVLATAKHFVGYAVTEGGQNMAATAVGARELYDVHARPFEAAIRLAGLATVMPSYSEFDGVPISASHAVLTDMLRGRMGFTGTTVSDYVAVGFLHTRQRVAETPEEAGALALAAGMDVETPAVYGYGQVLAKAVRDGKVPESLLDRSVRRVLRDKFALGLFDNPYVPEDPVEIRTVASEGADLSRRLAAESVTLLKNEKGLLPLSRDIAKIAIIGPHADDVEAGFTTYTYPAGLKMMHARATGGDIAMAGVDLGGGAPPEAKAAVAAELAPVFKTDRRDYLKSNYSAVSLAEAVRQLLPKAEVTAVAGTGVVPSEPTDIPAAVAAARNADVVILAVGGRSAWSDERTEGEGSDTANKDLPPQQVELINAVTAVGKPTIAVISMGGPYALASVIDKLPAVLTDLLRRTAPGDRDRRRHLRRHEPRRETAVHAAAARGAGADPPRPEMGQRLPADQGRHPQGLPRHAVHAAVRLRPRPELHDLRVQPAEAGERHRRRERRSAAVAHRHQHGQAARDRGRAALRRRHGHRRDAARAAAHRVRPRRPGARRVEDRHVRGADEPARPKVRATAEAALVQGAGRSLPLLRRFLNRGDEDLHLSDF